MRYMACRSEVSCIQIMAPFLWYLYCEPSQLEEYAKLRLTLLKVLLQPRVPGDTEQPSTLEQQILQLCCDMVPCLQVRPSCPPLLTQRQHQQVLLVIVNIHEVRTHVICKLKYKLRSRNACRLLEMMKGPTLDLTLIHVMLTSFTEI